MSIATETRCSDLIVMFTLENECPDTNRVDVNKMFVFQNVKIIAHTALVKTIQSPIAKINY